MALSDRDIIITPNRGASSEPIITLRGADAASSATMVMRVINSSTVSTLSFEGTTGQLFAVSDTFAGTIFSVNDVSGIPSIEVIDNGDIKLAEWNGKVRIGGANNNENATSTSTGELQVVGGVGVSRDVFVGGGMTVVGTLNAAVIAGSISNATNATNAANVAVTDDPNSGSTMYPTFVSATSGNQAIRTDSNGLVWIPSTNRLGIGTTSPGARLHVLSSSPSGAAGVPASTDLLIDSSTNSYLTFRQSADIGAYGGMQWVDNNVGAYIVFRNFTASGTAVGSDSLIYGTYQDHIFQAGTSETVNGKTEVMRITQAGNVGIGDTTPTEKLVVAGSAVITGGVYGSETGAPDARIWSVSPANPTWGIFYNEGTPDYIEYKAAGTVTTRFALDTGAAHFGISGGSVGIGTDAPDIKLDVRGTDTVIQAREDGTSSAWRARILSRNSSANKAAFLGTYASAPGVFAHNYALSAWADLYVNTTNGSGDGANVILAGAGSVGIGNSAPGRKLDVSGVTNVSSHITQGTLISRPNVSWGASGTSTGAVVIKFPGGSGNYGMIHAVIDIYTYDGENASTIIIGGHNWNSAWYNFGATRIGAFSKGVRLGFKDGQYCIVLGTNTSTWSYGQVIVRKIQNGSYYSGVMDLGGTYSIAQDAAAESYSYISSNLITTGSAGGGGWNSGNDGSGSGLDADLIDGLDSTAFLRRDVSNSMFAGQGSQLSFENQGSFFRFAFNDLRFYDWNNGIDIFGLDEHAYATTSMRAPIFYDRNDTNYYLDPSSYSRLLFTSVYVGQENTGAANSSIDGLILRGNYNSNSWAHKFHKFDNGGGVPLYLSTTVGSGAWSPRQAWGNGLSYDSQIFGSLGATSAVYSPIFYDSNDTTYYLDPAADLSLRVYGEISNSNYVPGNLQPGALNIGRTDRDYGWDSTSWSGDVRAGILANCSELWEFVIHDSGDSVESVFRYNGGDQLLMGRDIGWGTLYIEAANSFRAPIFYDSNNTGYYTDPASTSVVNNLTVNGTLTYTGTIAAGVDYARRIDNASRTAISVGGNASTFYPVVLQIGAGATAQQYGEFVLERGGYDDPGYTGVNFSTFNMRMSVKASGWGFGSTYENCEALYQNVQLVANWQQVSESSRLIIWLRGATVYYLWNVVGNTTLVNANAAGGNIVETNPAYYTYTFTPTTTIQPKAQHSKYFNSGAFFDGNTRAASLGVGTNASGTNGRLDVSSDVRAPIYYDLDNTGFYLDPNTTGTSLNIAGSVRAATHNKPGLLSVASGTSSSGGSIAIQQETGEGWTGIFCDFEPYTGWGLWHDNPNNYFSFTSESATGQIRSFTVPSRVSGNRTAYEKFRVDQNSGDTITGAIGFANASFRAPIFYDSNDTAYYYDGAGVNSTRFEGVNPRTMAMIGLSGQTRSSKEYYAGRPRITSDQDYWTGALGWGTVDMNEVGNWGSGFFDSWSNPANQPSGTSHWVGTQAYHYSNGSARYGWQLAGGPISNLRFRNTWPSFSGWTTVAMHDRNDGSGGALYAGSYYDSNDTAFFCDPNGRSRLSSMDYGNGGYFFAGGDWGYRHNTPFGWIQFGPANTSHAHIYTDRSNFYFNAQLQVNGGSQINTSDIRANIFYDQNDTGFYTDPASTSRMRNIDVASGVQTSNYYDAAIEIREFNFGGTQADTWANAPRLAFHWGGRVASSIAMGSNGWIAIMNNPGTGYENLIAAQGLFTSEVTAYYSDIRLKTKIGNLDNAVEKVKAIETFKYVNNELANSLGFTDTDIHIGVSAQSVEAVLPEVVKHAPFDMKSQDGETISASGEWYKTVQYDKLVPLLIEAIKEQQTTIEQMRTELDELRELKELVKKSLGK
jgi:hypothetical protein